MLLLLLLLRGGGGGGGGSLLLLLRLLLKLLRLEELELKLPRDVGRARRCCGRLFCRLSCWSFRCLRLGQATRCCCCSASSFLEATRCSLHRC